MEDYLGCEITQITDHQISGTNDAEFVMNLPIGEARPRSPNLKIVQQDYVSTQCTFTGFHKQYSKDARYDNLYTPQTVSEVKCDKLLREFLSTGMHGYESNRTKVSANTSCLSPYFALGVMSFQQLTSIVRAASIAGSDHEEFERQCHWILYCKLRARDIIDTTTPPPLTQKQRELFVQWMDGELPERTPVDAFVNKYMRMMRKGLIISNRFRLMTSHYLYATLGIDWRYGEYYFRNSLIDAHCLVNYYNWHWQCCRNRFFKMYNLERQITLHGDDNDRRALARWSSGR
jgi:deoxyribodipyrimidine photolyase